MTKTLYISFYSNDEYYIHNADKMKKNLSDLNVNYIIECIEKNNEDWIDICRKKISFINDAINKYNYDKIVWIDIDNKFNFIPSFIDDFDCDFMAFRKGFPESHQYKKIMSRQWSPTFMVFKNNDKIKKFLNYAISLEKNSNFKATDDYFLEESWKKFKNELNVYEIPGEYCLYKKKDTHLDNFSKIQKCFFLELGLSSNVNKYKTIAKQHSVGLFSKTRNIINKILYKYNLLKSLKPMPMPVDRLISLSRKNINILTDSKFISDNNINEHCRVTIKSMMSYRHNNGNILLHWFFRPYPGNMGDWLSPYIVNKISQKGVVYVPANKAKLFAIGSIGKLVTPGQYVWGTGISTENTQMCPNATYICVRGPYTRAAIIKNGGICPEVFGDPGAIISRFYNPKTIPIKGNYGLVRHYIHQKCNIVIDESIKDINILLSQKCDIERFIDELYSCECIITSSLHVLILCHSYGIPSRLISFEGFENCIHGDGIKYKDYMDGADIKYYDIISLKNKISKDDVLSLARDDKTSNEYKERIYKSFFNIDLDRILEKEN